MRAYVEIGWHWDANRETYDRQSSVVPARISSQSSSHCWRSPLPHASALVQRDFGCILGVQRTKQLPHVAPVDLGASRPGKQFNLVIDEEPLDNVCQVWSCIMLLKYGCGQALKVSKDILLSSYHWWLRRLWFCVKGRSRNGRLADRPLCCKRR
ncbi:hypothetical protein TNCV_2164711 [Trichonephila clavipes]|nr:hypothetical protein TNCV_2164711 [Trichonephila clavipes]